METRIDGNVKTVIYTSEDCQNRIAEITDTLAGMGMTITDARARRRQYQLTEAQYALTEELDRMEWLAE